MRNGCRDGAVAVIQMMCTTDTPIHHTPYQNITSFRCVGRERKEGH